MGTGWACTSVAVRTVANWTAAGDSHKIASVLEIFAKKTIGIKGAAFGWWVDKMRRTWALDFDVPDFLHYLHYDLEQVTSAGFGCLSSIMEPVLCT